MNVIHNLAEGPMLPHPAARGRQLRAVVIAALIIVIAAFSVAHRPLLAHFARLFRVDNPVASDAIVLLTGGWLNRPLRAAELYRQGLAPIILISASEPIPYPDLCDSALNRRVLLRAGVPDDRIVILPKISTSTREEALQVRDYVRAKGLQRIIVVSTSFHTSRAHWIFERVLRGTGVDVRAAAADDPKFNESNWYANRGLRAYLQEGMKRLFYQVVY